MHKIHATTTKNNGVEVFQNNMIKYILYMYKKAFFWRRIPLSPLQIYMKALMVLDADAHNLFNIKLHSPLKTSFYQLYFPNVYIFWFNLARQVDVALFVNIRSNILTQPMKSWKCNLKVCSVSRERGQQCWVRTWRSRIPWSRPRSPGRTCDAFFKSLLILSSSLYLHLSYRGWYWPE